MLATALTTSTAPRAMSRRPSGASANRISIGSIPSSAPPSPCAAHTPRRSSRSRGGLFGLVAKWRKRLIRERRLCHFEGFLWVHELAASALARTPNEQRGAPVRTKDVALVGDAWKRSVSIDFGEDLPVCRYHRAATAPELKNAAVLRVCAVDKDGERRQFSRGHPHLDIPISRC